MAGVWVRNNFFCRLFKGHLYKIIDYYNIYIHIYMGTTFYPDSWFVFVHNGQASGFVSRCDKSSQVLCLESF